MRTHEYLVLYLIQNTLTSKARIGFLYLDVVKFKTKTKEYL